MEQQTQDDNKLPYYNSTKVWCRYHRNYLEEYLHMSPEEIDAELELMVKNTKLRKPNVEDGYDSQEERKSRRRTIPKHMLEHSKPVEELTPEEIYKDMDALRVTSESPIRFGETKRFCFHRKYCWASINEAAVDKIAEFVGSAPLLEIGSGSGVMAFLLRAKGVNVIATDNYSPEMQQRQYFYVQPENLDADAAIAKYGNLPGLVLLISWGRASMVDAFNKFTGNKYIYIGECAGGCTYCWPDPKVWDDKECVRLSKAYAIRDVLNESLRLCVRKVIVQ